MGQVVLTYKKDLVPMIPTYPGNYSRRHVLKKTSGVDNYSLEKSKQLCRWWMKEHGIPRNARIMYIGENKKDRTYQIDWYNSIKDIQNGRYNSSHFWLLRDKDGNLNEMRKEHEDYAK